jgi:O-antigen/teichoic acid export membrane protein
LLVGVITSLWNTSAVVPMSINRHCRIAVAFAGSSLLSLALAGILIPSGGTGGAAVALLVADAYMVALVLRTALRHVQDTLGMFVPALFVVPPFRHSLHTAPEA